MDADEFKRRTKEFGLRVVRLVDLLSAKRPRKDSAQVIGMQLLRAATSVGANYRAACRARSDREFLAKMGIVLEEADESLYWLELVAETGLVPKARLTPLMEEANALVAMCAASLNTAARRSAKTAG